MSYTQLIERLFSLNLHGGMKLGLKNAFALNEAWGFPDRSFKSIHVAGTNGKGSVCTKIAKALEKAGYRVGLYTSPHLYSFRERIKINDVMISENDISHLLSMAFDLLDATKIPATFFELTTAIALKYFAMQGVTVAVLETGLGGRLDATNIVFPVLSVITSISLDHTEILGSTLEDICREKAGIIKPDVPVVIGARVPKSPLQEIAHLQNSPCISLKKHWITYDDENKAIARRCLNDLKKHFKISDKNIQAGIATRPLCRFEILKKEDCLKWQDRQIPNVVILDVAHNPDGLSALFKAVRQKFPFQPIRCVVGLSKNKDILSCLSILNEYTHFIHLIEAPNGRGVNIYELLESSIKIGFQKSRISIHSDIDDSIRDSFEKGLKNNEIVVICGTFFIMQSVSKVLGLDRICDSIDLNERHRGQHLGLIK